MEKNIIFVYSTLKTGSANHHLLINDGAQFLDYATAFGCELYQDDSYNFPICYKTSDQTQQCRGELYSVSDQTLIKLDILESVASGYYQRETITARTDAGIAYQAFIYLFGVKKEELVNAKRISTVAATSTAEAQNS